MREPEEFSPDAGSTEEQFRKAAFRDIAKLRRRVVALEQGGIAELAKLVSELTARISELEMSAELERLMNDEPEMNGPRRELLRGVFKWERPQAGQLDAWFRGALARVQKRA